MTESAVPTLTGVLEELDASPAPPLTEEDKKKHELRSLPDEEKWARAWQLNLRGIPVENIGKMFGVDKRTIYRWFTKAKELFRQSFEEETAVDVLLGELMRLNNLEEVLRYEAAQLEGDSKRFDPTTGRVVEDEESVLNRANARQKYYKQIADVIKQRSDLMARSGILPSEIDRLYKTLKSEGKAQVEEDVVSHAPKDRKTAIGELLNEMERGRTLS